jgi:hypothetical protein
MKSRDIASLVFKIMGIFALVQSMSLLSYIIHLVLKRQTVPFEFISYIPISFGVYLGMGLTLILASKKIAKLVCREDDDVNISCTAKELQAIAFSCIGLWLICSSVPGLINNVIHYFRALQGYAITPIANFSIKNTLQMLLGVVLFVQSRGLATLWEKLNEIRNPVHKD